MKTYSSLRIEKTITLGFLSLIAAGTLLLWTLNSGHEKPLSLLDALFTSTSAVCVTGLVVVDTGRDLAPASQWVVIVLIQLGGLGVMTAATAIMVLLGRRVGIRQRLLFTGGFGVETPSGAVKLLYRMLGFTFIMEIAASIPLFIVFLRSFSPGEALFDAVFHSVSAFCNAGFSTLRGGLEGYSGQFLLPGVIMILIVTGGLGFLVIGDLFVRLRERSHLSAHSILVLRTTAVLVAGGAVLLLASDSARGLSGHPLPLKIWNALFQSVTARTAGFNTIPIPSFSSLGVFVLCILVVIGASPGSTGGGIKTTTAGLLFYSSLSEIRGKSMAIGNRKISDGNVRRALAVAVLYILTVLLGIILLCLFEPFPFGTLAFEAVSAMGTVGLSLGVTPSLSAPGKVIIILLMFWGRVGILTFMYGMISRDREASKITFAETNIPVG
ncbi:trk system potassium uptake protein TrkH [Aminivibrio pyruvatiphilus]|uniref:Trk system potassium uptake protein TrkH n=1 Tax=Aminivibrio pyruvatiphilus TaxID=1005740 RepID=A0A4R8M8B1_9BACT|nr:potassium transporter TrkG [Aminivibrio pyruvatiphilus]TDY59975.1 trk system potassium uptake protein TrkH [Aminivibrio pyruvatiphilus]